MKEKFSRLVIRARVPLLLLCVVLSAVCVPCIQKTRINYDLSTYLSDDSMTKRSLTLMEEEFGDSATLRLMFKDFSLDAFNAQLTALSAMPEVAQVSFDESAGVMTKDGAGYRLVTLMLGEGDGMETVKKLRAQFEGAGEVTIAGSYASTLEIQERIAQQIPLALAVSVLIVLIVLLLSSHAWIEPLLILLSLAVSILINMGTNFIFSSVSFVTYAVCAILQLALSLDYAIMLLHSYQALRETGLPVKDAAAGAVSQSLMPVSSSALTTVAGLMSLSFMSFSIGIDIGVVLSKGVLVSLLTVFLLMPALIVLFSPALEKTRHKPLKLGGAGLSAMSFRLRKILPAAMLAVIIAAFFVQSGNAYIFHDMTEGTAAQRISDVFGESSQLVVLLPVDETDEGYERQRALIDKVSALSENGQSIVLDTKAMVTTGAAALTYLTPQEVSERFSLSLPFVNLYFSQRGWAGEVRADVLLSAAAPLLSGNAQANRLVEALDTARQAFNGKNHARILFDLRVSGKTAAATRATNGVLDACRSLYGEDFYVTGDLMSMYDIGNAFGADLLKINLITALAIFLIVALSFRSFSVAALLVAVIEGAIWISMSVSRLTGEPVFFMAYLICVAVQMGATIDYGILLTNHYLVLRKTKPPKDALQGALVRALPTILTSGTIFIGAGYAVGRLCTVYSISTIGLMISRGALVSLLLILTLLPALLALVDRFIVKQKTGEAANHAALPPKDSSVQ